MFGPLAYVIETGSPRAVTAREIQRGWRGVVSSLRAGERLVITHQGRPQAIMFGLRDVVELGLDSELRRLEEAAFGDWEDGSAVELLADTDPRTIHLAKRAAQSIETQDRLMLSKIIKREIRLRRTEEQSPHWVQGIDGGGRWLVPFSLMSDSHPSAVLLHDVIDAWEVEKTLIGPVVARSRSRRDAVRLEHCREPGPAPLSPTLARSGPSGPRRRPWSSKS